MTTYTIAGRAIEITEAPAFNRLRAARYIFTLVGAAGYAQDFDTTYATEQDALAAARRHIGVDAPAQRTCPCGKSATMNAAGGATCDDCYDRYSDTLATKRG